MPARERTVTTVEELLALPDDGLRHELLDGEHVVTPAPPPQHQEILSRLEVALAVALEPRDDLQVYHSPADVELGPRTLVQPDLFVVRKAPGARITTWKEIGTPLLAVEVLSPTTASRDRGKKRKIYQDAGIAEYWIVDLDARIVERWTPSDERPEILDGEVTWLAQGGGPVRLDFPAMFRRVLGD